MKLRVLSQQYETFSFQDRGFTDFWFDAGVGCGKTYIAPRWVHRQIKDQPTEAIGFIGANDYDQLNMAVMPPLLSYLDEVSIGWVMHQRPPRSWHIHTPFPVHKNILSLSTGHQVICKPMREKHFNIPGIQIAWWWIDEIGDVPQAAMEKVRERRRQPGCKWLGLVTGTPNGPDHFTFKDYMNPSTRLPRHGFTQARTIEGVEAGWLSPDYYNLLKSQYSKRKAAVRLDGEVMDTEQLRAYESHDTKLNQIDGNPFNEDLSRGPSKEMPIGIFCDFNPKKVCIWELGNYDHRHSHIFDEVALETTRVEVMFRDVLRRYGRWSRGFHFYGDASGTRDEMSSGHSCFETLRSICNQEKIRAQFFTPRSNPQIVDRLESMNMNLQAYDGTVKLTYDSRCIHLHLDFLRVGWNGLKLLDGSDPDRTHASDAVGYHIHLIRPSRGPSYVPISGHSDTIHS